MIPIRQNLQYLSLENQRNTPVKMGQIFVRVNFQFLNFGEISNSSKKVLYHQLAYACESRKNVFRIEQNYFKNS